MTGLMIRINADEDDWECTVGDVTYSWVSDQSQSEWASIMAPDTAYKPISSDEVPEAVIAAWTLWRMTGQ